MGATCDAAIYDTIKDNHSFMKNFNVSTKTVNGINIIFISPKIVTFSKSNLSTMNINKSYINGIPNNLYLVVVEINVDNVLLHKIYIQTQYTITYKSRNAGSVEGRVSPYSRNVFNNSLLKFTRGDCFEMQGIIDSGAIAYFSENPKRPDTINICAKWDRKNLDILNIPEVNGEWRNNFTVCNNLKIKYIP